MTILWGLNGSTETREDPEVVYYFRDLEKARLPREGSIPFNGVSLRKRPFALQKDPLSRILLFRIIRDF